jgi:nucleoside-diphosphate-sugar epimerase
VKVKGKRIFITGGAGFIGTALTRRLAEDNEVIIYDNLYHDAISRSGLLQHKNVKLIQGDILDLDKLKREIDDSQVVIHLAAIVGVDNVLKDMVGTLRVNVIGTYNIIEAARTLSHLECFVDFSTSEVFGNRAYKVDELHETSQGAVGEARWTYAVSKLVGEHLSHAFYCEYNLPSVSIRPFNIYGPRQVVGGVIKTFVLRAIRDENLIIHGDGSQIRAWCYIDDLVDAVLLTLNNPESIGHSFNIGNPRSATTVYNLALEVIRLSGAKSQIKFKHIDYPDIEIRIPDINKARKVLNYEPKIELKEGLKLTIDWYRKHLF